MKPNISISPVSTINIYNAFDITMYLVILKVIIQRAWVHKKLKQYGKIKSKKIKISSFPKTLNSNAQK